MNSKTILKKLPLLTVLAASLVLSPAIVMAGNGNSERGHFKEQYSKGDYRSHSSSRNHRGELRNNRHDKHSNKHAYRSYGKDHRGHNKHRSARHYDRGHSHQNSYSHYKRRHDGHRHDHHTTYVVNDHHYSDNFYGLDPLRFMIGLHTDNFDITFRD